MDTATKSIHSLGYRLPMGGDLGEEEEIFEIPDPVEVPDEIPDTWPAPEKTPEEAPRREPART